MKTKKGFTLIELLAVIVILAVAALVSTPIIIGVIDKARKGAFEDSAYGVLDAGKLYVINEIASKNRLTENRFDFTKDVTSLHLTGEKPVGGELIVDASGREGLAIWDPDKKWCAYKDYEQETVSIIKYNEEDCKVVSSVSGGGSGSSTIIEKNKEGNTEGLFTDDFGNTRYAGNNSIVKNYVRYNNEEWRIIGVFDEKIKIVKEESIGANPWSRTPLNNWAISDMEKLLNESYYKDLTTEAKNMIEKTKFYLGGYPISDVSKKDMYTYERSQNVCVGNPTEWVGKIGLMYPSDYAYAASKECSKNLNTYGEEDCKGNNWIYKSGMEWLMTPNSSISTDSFNLYDAGYVSSGNYVTNSFATRPALYLKKKVEIVSGEGTEENPYTLVLS